ncbi:MAG: cytochrome c oxidase accessory protein CcoG [Rhodocyclaceae bacterium]|nr:cytochrome c oxidase accessory protein CcoG [Rhodocyclaceae bacterium]MBL0076817.1 cytochrome c oxidase accessory protein CcoG [Rhodocyclaceae bacterium]
MSNNAAPRRVIPIVEVAEDSLYEVRRKVYPRAVTGTFARWRWTLVWFTQILYYGMCWMPWNGRQAVLFHLVERKFYIFGMVLWPQDVFFLAVLLIISAFSLFLFTAVAGRLWCGYACPQTVYTEIFLWVEKFFQGDRAQRMRRDAARWKPENAARRFAKYFTWAAISLWTGFTFVGYFSPMNELVDSVLNWQVGPWELFWILFYGGSTYMGAGVLREQVCKYMCPYARFQSVMFDADTLVITYDTERGEARGGRKKGLVNRDIASASGMGDCVDCSICVQVCPTGIDIRNGLQYECIGCGACIDACDQVMEKMEYPKGLIRYSTQNALAKHWQLGDIVRHIVRPRILIYSTLLVLVGSAFIWGLASKPALRVDVSRDRASLAREVEGGLIENVYRLHVMNVSEVTRRYAVSVSGLSGIEFVGEHIIEVPATSAQSTTLRVRAPADGKRGAHVIYFDVKSIADERIKVHEKASFIQP